MTEPRRPAAGKFRGDPNMQAENITVNRPVETEPENEKHYDGNPGETPDQIISRVIALHPDWTSMVLVISRDVERPVEPLTADEVVAVRNLIIAKGLHPHIPPI
jgi:hypothetical protein